MARKPQLAWVVNADGRVSSRAGENVVTGASPALATCLTGVLQRLMFPTPEPEGAVRVTLPIVITPPAT